MDKLKGIVSTLDHILNTPKKRHIVGGVLLSASIFFGGLALTVMSMKAEENKDEQQVD